MGSLPYPVLTCPNCGETKSAMHFPKAANMKWKLYKAYQAERYDKVCKKCRKPRREGQAFEEVKAPKIRNQSQSTKAKWKKIKAERPPPEKLSPNEYKQKVRRETRINSMRYLAKKGCEECGARDPRYLEYDHKEPEEKTRGIARLIIDGFSWSSRRLRQEIRKCRILCANCHRKHTIEQQGYYAHEDIQRELGVLAARYKFDL